MTHKDKLKERLRNKKVYSLKDAIALVNSYGWYLSDETTSGSHLHFRHDTKPGLVIIPAHNKDIKKGTMKNILKQAGIDDFNE